jgi:type II secretory pathway pseudopilin PulG
MDRSHRTGSGVRGARVAGFSLVELLTVMFIISLLIGLLIPSLNSARNAAKKSATMAVFRALEVGLDLFKTDHERTFRRTNGYPPSFAHPPIPGPSSGVPVFTRDDANEGRFPFAENTPVVCGAHWLPAMLMGVDGQGYISPQSVPKTDDHRTRPWDWYRPPPDGPDPPFSRSNLYADPGGLDIITTRTLPGSRDTRLFPDWADMRDLPVIVDPFDQAVLYYVANANGKGTNMVGKERAVDNVYKRGPQENGPPIYFHQDNQPFTGEGLTVEEDGPVDGWNFGGGSHAISDPGESLTASDITEGLKRDTFARFILDRKQYQSLQVKELEGSDPSADTPLRPVNPDSYLLISAGVDGRYGTNDDITNFPTSLE